MSTNSLFIRYNTQNEALYLKKQARGTASAAPRVGMGDGV